MADLAVKLGNTISDSLTKSLAGISAGIKGSMSGAVGFMPMVSAFEKGFSAVEKQVKVSNENDRNRELVAQREQGFTEEATNEQRRQDQIALAIQKGMAINIEAIQKDVRQILEIMSKESFLDKLGDFLKGLLLAIPALLSSIFDELVKLFQSFATRIGTAFDEFIKFMQSIPSRISSAFDELVKFIQSLPSRISSAFDDIVRFIQSIPSRIATTFDEIVKFIQSLPSKITSIFDEAIKFIQSIPSKIGNFFGEMFRIFDDFVKTYLPNTRAAIVKFFDDIAKVFRIDDLKAFVSSNIENLFKAFKFDDLISSITTKFDELARIFSESDLAKGLRRIRNVFVISFAQFADELETMFNDNIVSSINKIRTSVTNLGEKIPSSIDEIAELLKTTRFYKFSDEFSGKIMSVIDDAVNSLKSSRLIMFGEEFGGKIMTFFDGTVDALKVSRLGTFGSDFGGKIMTFFDDAATAAKSTKLGTLADDIVKIGGGIFRDIGNLIKTGVDSIAPDVSDISKIGADLFKSIGSSIKTGLGAITPDVSDLKTFFTLGKEAMDMEELKYVLGEGGLFQKTATLIGKFAGTIGTTFRAVGNFFTGNNILGQIAGFDDLMKLFGHLGNVVKKGLKAVPVLGQIIMAIEGLFAAFDTEQIALDLNKQASDVNWKDRLFALFGGVLGSVAGIIDLVFMGINAVFDTEFTTSGPNSIQGRVTSFMTKFFSDLGSIIGSTFTLLKGLITFDKSTIDRAAGDISRVFNSMLGDLGDVFAQYVTLPAKQIYNAAIGLVEGITNWLISSVNELAQKALGSLPSKFSAFGYEFELISEERKRALAQSMTISPVDFSGAKVDVTPPVSGKHSDQSAAETARLGRQPKPEATKPEATKPPKQSAADPKTVYALMDNQSGGYTRENLASMGLNVKQGDVQASGAYISPVVIDAAKTLQSNVSGIRFTGFNDQYHQEKSPNSLHTKGLAFDFTIPPNLASNDDYREAIANAVANGTGGRVIDEYARPSAKSTGGHFHVDFAGGKEVDLGTGTFAGVEKSKFPSVPVPKSSGMPSVSASGASDGISVPNYSVGDSAVSETSSVLAEIDYTLIQESVDTGVTNAIQNSSEIFAGQDILTAIVDLNDQFYNSFDTLNTSFETNIELAFLRAFSSIEFTKNVEYATAEGHWTAINREASPSLRGAVIETSGGVAGLNTSFEESQRRQIQYEKERRSLEREFNSELQSIFRPLVGKITGPVGEVSRYQTDRAGSNISETFLSDQFKQYGVKIFGKEQGAAIGETFMKLGGVYMNEFINEALAPALGMNSKYLNRSINTFLEGYKQTQPQVKELEKRIGQSKKELETFKKEKGDITTADIIRAGGRKGFTADEQSRLNEINRISENIKRDQEALSKTKETQKEFKKAAFGDLIYGMTGVAITPRNAMEQIYGEKGSQGLVEDLASIFGAPFSGLFKGKSGSQVPSQQQYQMRTPGFISDQQSATLPSSRDGYNKLAEITNREIQSRKDIVAQEKQSRENIIAKEIQAKTDISQTEIDSRKESVDAQRTNDQQHIQDVYGVYQGNVQSTYAVNQDNLQSHIALNDAVQTNQTGIFDWFINSMNSVFTAGADLFKNVMSNISVSGGSSGNIVTSLIGDIGSSVVKGAIKDLTKDTAANAAEYITDEFGNIFKAPSSSGTIIPGDSSYDTAETAKFLRQASEGGIGGMNNISMSETSWSDMAKNFFGGKTGSSALNRVGNFATNYITGAISNKISNALGGGFSGQLGAKVITDMGLNFLQTGAMNPIQSIGKSFGMNLSSGATFSDLLTSFSKYGSGMMMSLGSTVSSVGANLGSQFMTELGAGMVQSGAGAAAGSGATAAMNMGQSLGSIGAAAGNAFMAYNLSKMIGGEYKTGLPINEIAALASFIPGVGPIAGVVGGLINRAFGMGPKKVRATRIAGTLKKDGSNLRTEQDWKKKGGWFRKSKYGTDVTAFAQEDTNAVNDVLGGIYENLDIVSKGLKLDIGRAFDFSKDINFDVTGLSAEQQQQKWQEVFTAFNNEMYQYTFGAPLEAARKFKKDAQGQDVVDSQGNKVLESYEETLMRLGQVDQQFSAVMQRILEISGKNIDTLFTRVTGQLDNATKIFVADMKDAYIEAFGGIQELSRVQSEYIDLFYTPEEKRQQAIKEANRSIENALKDTNINFREFTEGFGTTTELQSMSQEDFMEAQRVKYRTMVEDFERNYGWMLSSTEENVQEYSRMEKAIKDAGSDFMSAAKLTWESAQSTKKVDDTPKEPVYYTRTRGKGPGPIGETIIGDTSYLTQAGANLSNVQSTSQQMLNALFGIRSDLRTTSEQNMLMNMSLAEMFTNRLDYYDGDIEKAITDIAKSVGSDYDIVESKIIEMVTKSETNDGNITLLKSYLQEGGSLNSAINAVAGQTGESVQTITNSVIAAMGTLSAMDFKADIENTINNNIQIDLSWLSDVLRSMESKGATTQDKMEFAQSIINSGIATKEEVKNIVTETLGAEKVNEYVPPTSSPSIIPDGVGPTPFVKTLPVQTTTNSVANAATTAVTPTVQQNSNIVYLPDLPKTGKVDIQNTDNYKLKSNGIIVKEVLVHDDAGANYQEQYVGQLTYKGQVAPPGFMHYYNDQVGEGEEYRLVKIPTKAEIVAQQNLMNSQAADGAQINSSRYNSPFLVGEVGPEIFIPGVSGTVVSTEQIVKALDATKSIDTSTRNALDKFSVSPDSEITNIYTSNPVVYVSDLNNTTEDAAKKLAKVIENETGDIGSLGDAAASAGTSVSEGAISLGLGMMAVSDAMGIFGGMTGLALGVIGGAIVDTQMDAISAQMSAIDAAQSAAAAIGGAVSVDSSGAVSVTAAETSVGISVASMDAALGAASADAGGQAAADSAAAAAAGVGISNGGGIDAMSGISDAGGGGDGGGGWASGGKFAGNHPMLVGEAGPEIIVPNQGGTVIPTHKIFEALKNSAPYDSMARNAIESFVSSASPTPTVVQNIQATPGSIAPSYMAQQEMNRMLQAERDIISSINNSMINQTINNTNVSSPSTSIIANGTSGVRSDNPITNAFTRSVARPRMY